MVWPDFDLKHLAKTQQFWATLSIPIWQFVGRRLLLDFLNRDVDKLWLGKALFLMAILNMELDWFWQWIVWYVFPSQQSAGFSSTGNPPQTYAPLMPQNLKKTDQPSPIFRKVQMSCCALLGVIYTLYIAIHIHTNGHIISTIPPREEDIKRHYLVALKITQV